ncbi:MAG: hypothetical protein MZV65_00145 [Chromatiales bacterium]|nr:hypothetical protein [Chromatiales bacterium]
MATPLAPRRCATAAAGATCAWARPGAVRARGPGPGHRATVTPPGRQARIDLDVGAPAGLPLVAADHDLVSEGLGRLVDHTVRHCPVGAKVRVTLQGQGDSARALVRGIEVDPPREGSAQGLRHLPGAGAAAADGDGPGLTIARRGSSSCMAASLEVTALPGLQASYAFALPRAGPLVN